MDEWTTNVGATTDDDGNVTFRGYHGTYEITAETADGQRTTASVELEPGTGAARFIARLGS
jgi:hypothetical protein